jgi:hypothetical protein
MLFIRSRAKEQWFGNIEINYDQHIIGKCKHKEKNILWSYNWRQNSGKALHVIVKGYNLKMYV